MFNIFALYGKKKKATGFLDVKDMYILCSLG